jgi:type I restriction enzyme, R subunit
MPSEAQARITINRLLEEAGWRLDNSSGKSANVICEQRTTGQKFKPTDDLGNDFESAPNGFVDYVLQNNDGRAVAVVEAKKESIDPLSAKEQARDYANNLGVAHIFLSNGLVHYYWNLRQGNPVKVSRFLPLEQLGKAAEWKPDSQKLKAVKVDENYVAVSQDSDWLKYTDTEKRVAMKNKKIRLLRDYQVAAIHALQKAATPEQHRYLFEMATGTGKTLLSAAVAKLYLRTDTAHRILFLVDRLELEKQAEKNFTAYLAKDGIQTVIFKQRRSDWKQAQVVVTTIQSLSKNNRFLNDFAPSDFQLIISDEAHRTISGNNRTIFEYFIGAKLGLTATPKDYLKGVDSGNREVDPREMEKRMLLDTYRTFGCPNGTPTFRFSLMDAVQHKPPYLVNPYTYDARTEITTQLLSDEGYSVVVPASEDGEEVELTFTEKSFERKFFSDETNRSFVKCFLDHAKADPITGEVGKSILFAVNRRHATKLVQVLNEEATKRWPEAYGSGSSFAVQVTSDIPGAQQMTMDFANNNMNGRSKWRSREFPDYNTSRTRVCVTVGMMTTGYDCEDLLNVGLVRPIFSPTDFIQIKGRGTRLYEFEYGDKKAAKTGFGLFDFFANCEYFEEDFNYDEELKVPKPGARGDEDDGERGGGVVVHPPIADTHTHTGADAVMGVQEIAVGPDGMRIDREMFRARERFARQTMDLLQQVPELKEAMEFENLALLETQVQERLFNKPEEYWNLEKLQDLYRTTDRKPTLREILSLVLDIIHKIPNRDELATEAFEKYRATQEFLATHAREVRTVFMSYVLNPAIRELVKARKFAELAARDAGLHSSLVKLEKDERENLLNYLQNSMNMGGIEGTAN